MPNPKHLKWKWSKDQFDTSVPPIIQTLHTTVFTRHTQSVLHRWGMPADEFKTLKNSLRLKQGVVWATDNPSYIIQLQENLILCI